MKFVALRTGLKPHLIRSWEKRYRAIHPHRSPNKRRCFTDDDIRRLRLLKRTVDMGHAISTVANLSNDSLAKLLARTGGRAMNKDGSYGVKTATNEAAEPPSEAVSVVEQALSHIVQLDAASLEQVLNASAVDLPRQTFLQEVILPLFDRIGDKWRNGQLKIVNEHLASVVVRSMLWEMLRSVAHAKTAPVIVVATPVGHWHEFGALAAALAAAESGWRVAYFGANLPPEEIAYAVKRLNAKALALSLGHLYSDHRLIPDIKKLRRLVGQTLPLFIGGPGASHVVKAIPEQNIDMCLNLNLFRDKLEEIAKK